MSSTTVRRLTIAAAGVAVGILTLGTAAAAPAPDTSARPTTTTGSVASTVERQTGTVLECAGEGVSLTLYENSRHGSSLQVVLGDPEDDRSGHVEQSAPFLVGGAVEVAVPVAGRDFSLVGTVTPTGRPTKVVEPVQDNGEQVVTHGTHTQLQTELSLTEGEATTALSCTGVRVRPGGASVDALRMLTPDRCSASYRWVTCRGRLS